MSIVLPSVVFDANIFVQAFLSSHGPSARCLELARSNQVSLFVSTATIAEVAEVINRPSVLSFLPDATNERIEAFISDVVGISEVLKVSPGVFKLDRDPKDEMLIELAVACDADFVVSWDNDLLDLMTGIDMESKQFRQRFRHLKIVRPDEFLRLAAASDLSLKP